MESVEVMVRLKTAIFSLKEAEKVAAEGKSRHAERIAELRVLLELLYVEVKKSDDER